MSSEHASHSIITGSPVGLRRVKADGRKAYVYEAPLSQLDSVRLEQGWGRE